MPLTLAPWSREAPVVPSSAGPPRAGRGRARPAVLAAAVLAVLAVLAAPVPAQADPPVETVVDVTAFGADRTGVQDSAAAVKAALRQARTVQGPVRVLFPRGTYQIYPEQAETRELYLSNTVGADQAYRDKRIGILMEDMRDVTIDGGGSHLQFHGLMTAFAAVRSQNVTVRGFSFDVTAPKVVDATVSETGVSDGRAYRVLNVPPTNGFTVANNQVTWRGETSPATGQPYWSGVNGMSYTQIHDPAARSTRRGANPLFTDVASMAPLAGNRLRIDYTSAAPPTDRGLVYQMREDTRDTASAFFWESKDVTVQGLKARYLHGFGFLGQMSENITIDGNDFRTDPAGGRSTAGFADFVQMSGIKGAVNIRNNMFDGAHDDAINIHGTYVEVTGRSADGRTLTLDYRHHQTAGFPQFYPGDSAEIVDKRTMAAVPGSTATVVSVDGPTGRDHNKPLTTMKVSFDRAVPASVTPGNFVVENTTYTPTVDISGNTVVNIPTRGILVTTRKPVVIRKNTFDGTGMAGIFISSDAREWYESGPVQDVLITDNTFLRPAGPAILVEPTNQVQDAGNPVSRNIRIQDNDFRIGDVRLLDAKSVGGITFERNDVRRLDRSTAFEAGTTTVCLAPGTTGTVRTVTGAAPYTTPLFKYRASSGALVKDNNFDNGLNLRADLNATDAAQVTTDEVTTNGTDRILPLLPTLTYTSSNPAVAAVDPSGTVTAKATGTALITPVTTSQLGDTTGTPVTIRVGCAVPVPVPVPTGNRTVSVAGTGDVVDVSGASTADGARVIRWQDGSRDNQRFGFTPLGDGYVRIVNQRSGKDLVVLNASRAAGAEIIQHSYSPGATSNDEWLLEDAGNGRARIANRYSGLYLTAGAVQGDQFQQRPYDTGGDRQTFTVS
ncbi:RICIN domain-containing protein [Kitasatospora purpeofusca]|uniref:RICIN domain-containing protein n=1 Tax=Kitasatospora purpeofusca TaxID=67352 RepID=UPI00365BE936